MVLFLLWGGYLYSLNFINEITPKIGILKTIYYTSTVLRKIFKRAVLVFGHFTRTIHEFSVYIHAIQPVADCKKKLKKK